MEGACHRPRHAADYVAGVSERDRRSVRESHSVRGRFRLDKGLDLGQISSSSRPELNGAAQTDARFRSGDGGTYATEPP
jgi:hypothetical protein